MDLLSSDDEYFDTYSDIVAESNNINNIPFNSLNNNDKCITEENAVNNTTFNINENLSNETICGNQLYDKNDLNIDLNNDTLKCDSNDSSDSESLINELINCDINETKEDIRDNDAKGTTETEVAKSNEEIEFEERLKLEVLLSEEELNNLRLNSLDLKDQGNTTFRSQSYEAAIDLYNRAIATCPLKFKYDHAIFYFNRGTAFAKLEKNEEAIKDLSVSLDLKPDYLKALLKRAELREKTDKLSEALDDYRAVLKIDPRNWSALHAEQTFPERIRVQQEKMKEEMMNQLKQLGNLVLKPFGLSTDNFKMVQDPATGSYSINFQNK